MGRAGGGVSSCFSLLVKSVATPILPPPPIKLGVTPFFIYYLFEERLILLQMVDQIRVNSEIKLIYFVSCRILKYLKILDFSQLFVADALMKI